MFSSESRSGEPPTDRETALNSSDCNTPSLTKLCIPAFLLAADKNCAHRSGVWLEYLALSGIAKKRTKLVSRYFRYHCELEAGMKMLSSAPGICLGFVATAATFSSPSFSQVEASEPIEEIVVTAQHREELAKNVPIAVSVVSGEDLRRGEIRSLQELGARATGLVTTDSVNYGFAPLSIRGVGGANGGGNIFADEPVAVYQDGALVARLRMSTADLLDIKRVEVLRGPQGVLFGRNSTAGAVLIHSAEPTTVLSGHLRGSVSSIGTFRMQGAVSGPIDDDARLSLRLAGGGSWREGFGSNAYGERLNGGYDARLRAFLRFTTQDRVQLDLIGEISRSRNEPGTIAIADLSDMSDERYGFPAEMSPFPLLREKT